MGLQKTVLTPGNGAKPSVGQKVTVHCTGYVAGDPPKKFWSTHDTNSPFSFNIGLGKVIKGWDQGVLDMQIGEKTRLTMTSDMGYGENGFPAWGIPGGATLIFDVELLSIQ